MVRDSGRNPLPPYVSYRTFLNFIERLQQGGGRLPNRIDKSYWGDKLSGSTGTQLTAAMRFLGLIDATNRPTSQLGQLVAARGTERSEVLKQITSSAFGFVLKVSDSQTATYSQVEEIFHRNFELKDTVCRKCVKFFIDMANNAGVPLSPFVLKRIRSARPKPGTKVAINRMRIAGKRNLIVPQELEEVPAGVSWDKMLLAKFPTFDLSWPNDVKLGWLESFAVLKFPTFNPAWSDEVKLKWFEAFNKLLKRDLPKDV